MTDRRLCELRFDRGTVLLEHGDRRLGEMDLPGLLWDPRVAAFRAPGYRYPQITARLRQQRAGFVDLVRPGRAPRMIMELPSLRPYQSDALMSWEMSSRRGVVVLPTGSGKTHVALAAMARMKRSALVLVPTRVLLNQWVDRIRSCYQWPVGVYGDGDRSLGRVTVCTFESAYRHMDLFGDRFHLLVVDEAHHFSTGLRAEALEMCTAAARLGLTATPPDRADALARLDDLIGPVVCHLSISDMTGGGHLAPFDHLRLLVDLDPREREEYRESHSAFCEIYAQFRRAGGRAWSDFQRLAMSSKPGREAMAGFHRSRQVVNTARQKLALAGDLLRRHPGDRVLVFTADNQAAYALSRELLIPAITCDIGRKEREQVLDALRLGRVKAVVSSRVLNEGIDLPDARVGIVVGGSHGTREHVQRVGRLLRPQQGKRAVVYETVARDTYEERHAEKRQRSLVA